MRGACVLAVAALLGAASTSIAQPREPMPRLVIDARATSAGLPTAAGWTPTVPVTTEVPSRSLGFDVGAHVIFKRFTWGGFGVGADIQWGSGTTSPPEVEGQAALSPSVSTRVRSLLPQLSANFGHGLGWSTISAGIGRATVRSERTGPSATSIPLIVETEALQTFHFGGGVRWFLNHRFGVGFDLRWHKLPAVDEAPKASLLTAGVGVAVRY